MTNLKTCDICKISSSSLEDDTIVFGEWMCRGNLTVHYNCLLVSTHLPQNGVDTAGILGFLLRDIRKEIEASSHRMCVFCNNKHASVKCHQCHVYFHLDCGYKNGGLFQYCDDFRAYCDQCFPFDEHQRKSLKNPPDSGICPICQRCLSIYKPYNWLHANCCGNGWMHRRCIQKYALSAGYYLRCIWCKDIRFREMIRKLGVFVPDRDASWEREKSNYRDLYRGHNRCDIEQCSCPKGREYKNPTNIGGWKLLNCKSCGSFGVHLNCLQASGNQAFEHFECNICKQVEFARHGQQCTVDVNDKINQSFYIQKIYTNSGNLHISESPTFSKSDESSQTQSEEPYANVTQQDLCTEHLNHKDIYVAGATNLVAIDYNEGNANNMPLDIDQIYKRNTKVFNGNKRYHIFDAWKLVDNNCIGSFTFCVDLLDSRFTGLSTDQIEKSDLLDWNKDVIASTKERGIFDLIDNIIDSGNY